MKLILFSIIVVLNLNAGIFDFLQKKDNTETPVKYNRIETNQKVEELRTFEKTLDSKINNDLQSLNGYLENEIIKNFVANSKFITNLNNCLKKEKPGYISGNVGSRIYSTKCYKIFGNNYYTIFNEKYINRLISNIDIFLTKKYNNLIAQKAKILNIHSIKYQQKQLFYSIDTIPNAKREYVQSLSIINDYWADVIRNMTKYDESFGYLDNVKMLVFEMAMSNGDTNREQAWKAKNKSIQEIFNQTRLFLRLLTEDIKDKYKDDIKSQLSEMYMGDENEY